MTTQQNPRPRGRPWIPAYEGGPLVPPEPFAYLSDRNNPTQKIRSPLGIILMGLMFVALAVYVDVEMVLHDGPIVVGIVVTLMCLLFAAPVIYMGIKRWIWKRTYTRIVGHSPWEGIP